MLWSMVENGLAVCEICPFRAHRLGSRARQGARGMFLAHFGHNSLTAHTLSDKLHGSLAESHILKIGPLTLFFPVTSENGSNGNTDPLQPPTVQKKTSKLNLF